MGKGLGNGVQLKVTPEELQQKSSSTAKKVSQMQKEFDSLNSIISKTGSYWTGDGGNAHRTKFNEQKSDVDEMFRRINEHIVDLEKMAGVYNAAEGAAKSVIAEALPSDVII
ncbi:MAG: WXG100 family type VII secretion target [Eubacteriales bacterium]|nr:WXG100 family type VII secretion target [Eubacteriales bacterium]